LARRTSPHRHRGSGRQLMTLTAAPPWPCGGTALTIGPCPCGINHLDDAGSPGRGNAEPARDLSPAWQEGSGPAMSPGSRGFRGRGRIPAGERDRVPRGQYVTMDFPVLSAGPTPHTPLPEWTFSITQGGDTLKSWTWQEMQALPAETVTVDVHCVTRWSKLGTQWRGGSGGTLLGQAQADAPYVLAVFDAGHTPQPPVEDGARG